MIFPIIFTYGGKESCSGTWGDGSPPASFKSGRGHCELTFEFGPHHRAPWLSWEAFYDGDWLHGTKHGRGVYKSFSGSTYDDDWRHNRRHGHGTFVSSDGSRFVGQWRDDVFVGSSNALEISSPNASPHLAEARCLNGSTYVGSVQGKTMQGSGKISFGKQGACAALPDRVVTGQFADGLLRSGSIRIGSTIVTLESWKDDWKFGAYTADAIVSYGQPVQRFSGDGPSLRSKSDPLVLVSAGSVLNHTVSPLDPLDPVLLYQTLNDLKWFEFHWLFFRQAVTAEIYPFDYVDGLKPRQPAVESGGDAGASSAAPASPTPSMTEGRPDISTPTSPNTDGPTSGSPASSRDVGSASEPRGDQSGQKTEL
eukprot:TRINITY_DN32639_c0_g1_i1.p1 TRINITY_DN32639_c0_g1~~TRINITY_DN32639_c0_g1_i1.p1  ORF type:complete len:391 (+),score=90.51 TRINITY_DN32639_c0_g1_i1:75-1175(+)